MIPKPPLGVKPEYIMLEDRIRELSRASGDLLAFSIEVRHQRIPPRFFEYLDEMLRHSERLKTVYDDGHKYGGLPT